MTDETFDGKGIPRVWQGGTGNGQEIYQADGTDLKPGFFCTEKGETAATRDIDLASAGEPVTGCILKPVVNADSNGLARNLDAASVDNEQIWVQRLGFNNKVKAIYMAGGATSKRGTRIQIASEAGKIAPAAVAAGTATSPTDAELTAAQIAVIGVLDQDVTTDASNDQIVDVLI